MRRNPASWLSGAGDSGVHNSVRLTPALHWDWRRTLVRERTSVWEGRPRNLSRRLIRSHTPFIFTVIALVAMALLQKVMGYHKLDV